jgi:hypothetical protein
MVALFAPDSKCLLTSGMTKKVLAQMMKTAFFDTDFLQ